MNVRVPQALIDDALAGNPEATSALALLVRPLIERQLIRYALTPHDRDDLVQATMVQLLRHLPSFRGDANFSTWLFRVAANEALMLLRSRKRLRARMTDSAEFETMLEQVPSGINLDDTADDRTRETQVRTALSGLPDEYRDVVVAHYHLDLGLQEIADRFKLTESAVRSRLHRARARLRTLLLDGDYEQMAA
jgi:RNA polymerase sigma-70 factor, ECF subfamily